MGGQEGDSGVIETANGKFVVEDTIKLRGGKFGHVGRMESGMLSTGETVTLKVNEQPAVTQRKTTVQHIFFRKHSRLFLVLTWNRKVLW